MRTYQFAVLRIRMLCLMVGQFDLDSHVNKSDTAQLTTELLSTHEVKYGNTWPC